MVGDMKQYRLAIASLFIFLQPFCWAQGASISAAEQNEIWWKSFNLEAAARYTEAAQTIEPLLKHSSDKEFAELRSGWLYYLATDYSRAVKHYENALKLNKTSLETRLGMMLPLMAQQRWREAAQQANAVIEVSKWNYYAHLRLMICEEALGLWDQLAEHANQVHKRYPADPSLLVYLARGYANSNQRDKAKAAYQLVLNRMPGHVEASNYLAKH